MNNREALYLNNGESANRNNVCISGYDKSKPNFALSNFDNNNGKGYQFYDRDVGIVTFPTAEHYLHFQKLNKAGKEEFQAKFEAETSPAKILELIRTVPHAMQAFNKIGADGKTYFDDDAWDKQKYTVQMQINASKYEQSPAFKECIDNANKLGKCFGDNKGAACIIEDTATAAREETKWGTGPDGKGTNILGNTQTAFANLVASRQYIAGKAKAPMYGAFNNVTTNQAYAAAEKQYKEGVRLALIESRKNLTNKKVDTSEIAGVEKLTIADDMVLPKKPSAPNLSHLEPEPKDNPEHPTKEQQDRSTNLLHPDNVKKVTEHMKAQGWESSRGPSDGVRVSPVVFSRGSEKFTMDVTGYKTASSDVNTFIAMLQAFQVSNPGREPSITCSNDNMKSLWEEAYKTVYSKEPPAFTVKITPNGEPVPAREKAENATPGSPTPGRPTPGSPNP